MTIPKRTIINRIFRILLPLLLVFSVFLVQVQPAAAVPGIDGTRTITASDTVVNRYAPVETISGNVVTVTDIDLLDDGPADHYTNNDITAGDMILIYQAQGAAFSDSTDADTYGAFTDEEAGTYEFAAVVSVSGDEITVDAANTAPYTCGGITGTYDTTDGNVQVVRVPQYSTLTINSGGSVVAADWNGTTGGVVSVVVQSTLTINGSIDVSGQGFRGGAVKTTNNSDLPGTTIFRSTQANEGGQKGESILGFQTEYNSNNGGIGRGAPANGGGGGNAHNAGGGGGANGANGGTWTGHGSPDTTTDPDWPTAWDLDDGTDHGVGNPLPGYFNGGAGGGRGGYTYAEDDLDALTVPPGNGAWGGDNHRNVGGYGGRPLDNNPASQLFFGGGGGAGDANNNQGNNGGDGGGLVVIVAAALGGTGDILANGDSVPPLSGPDFADGNSGGGGGGTVVIGANTVSGVEISAEGGDGGNVDNGSGQACLAGGTETCTLGPGGGGGGGYVHINSGSGSLTTSVAGGANGIDTSDLITEFLPDGATAGYAGASSTADFSFPGCLTPTAVNLFGASANAATSVLPVMLIVFVLTTTLVIWRRRPLN